MGYDGNAWRGMAWRFGAWPVQSMQCKRSNAGYGVSGTVVSRA